MSPFSCYLALTKLHSNSTWEDDKSYDASICDLWLVTKAKELKRALAKTNGPILRKLRLLF